MKRVLAIVALVAVGCAKTELQPAPTKACAQDSDCPSAEVCLDVGCAAPDENLVVEVVPPADGRLTTQEFDGVDATKNLDLQLGAPAVLHLKSSLYPFTVELSATPPYLTDRPFTVPASVVTAESDLAVQPASYVVRATPADPTVPPIQLTANLGPSATLDVPLVFLGSAQIATLAGTLHSYGGDVRYDLQVLHADKTPASQTATTGVDGGPYDAFVLHVAPTDPGEQLTLSATPHASIGPTASFTGTFAALAAQAADGGFDLGLAQPITVHGLVESEDGAPVANAQVRLTAVLPGGEHYTSAVVTTDLAGAYDAICLHDAQNAQAHESYQVLVLPPDGSGLAMALLDTEIAWNHGATAGVVQVPKLTQVSGTVLDATGKPVAKATVHAVPAAGSTLPLVAGSATTDDRGAYALALTPGSYHIDFSPPLELVAPSGGRGPLTISGDAQTLPDLAFSQGRTVTGSVVDASGKPVKDALVSIYHVGYPANPNGGTGDEVRSTLLAQSVVLGDGSFTAVLPVSTAHH